MTIDVVPAITMEYASLGTLESYLKHQTNPIDWILKMKWSMQLSNILMYLHHRGIVHRDVRCVNILVSFSNLFFLSFIL